MNFQFDYYAISLLLGGFVALLSGFIVFLHNKRKLENVSWFLLNISSALWSFGYFSMATTIHKGTAWTSNIILHAAAIFIPIFYLLFTLAVTNTYKKLKYIILASSLAGFVFLTFNTTSYFITDVRPKGPFNFAPEPGPLYLYFTIYFFAIVIYSLIVEFIQYSRTSDILQKRRLRSILLFTIAGFGGGGSVFLLTFNIPVPPYPIILFSLYPLISGYAIFRYQLFNVKLITAQLVTFALWIFIFIRVLLSSTQTEQTLNIFLLLGTIIFGLLLLRSVQKEIQTREKIERLANDLSTANDRLKELDQQKSEFVSLASHQLRGPLTAVKGYASMVLEGDFGNMDPGVKDAVEKIYKSTQDLVILVGDYLDVSRIEQGRMQYDFTTFDLKDLAQQVATELQPNIEKAHLSFQFDCDMSQSYKINADFGKIKQVISNIIDNSIKYTPHGGIHMWLTKTTRKSSNGQHTHTTALITISDTGVGIAPEVLPKLFEKFTRAPDASKTNILGTGLGLYVARKMIEAHHGRIWAKSPGQGKGSSFFIQLDLAE